MKSKVVVFWFRRDLRLEDNTALHHALASGYAVLPIFIFDKNILERFEDKKDQRVDYIHQVLTKINDQLKNYNARLNTYYAQPLDVYKILQEKYDLQGVYCNRDYEPQAIKRDTEIYEFLKDLGIGFKAYKDQVIFDKHQVVKNDGTPYTVYTPYSKKWKERLEQEKNKSYKSDYTRFLWQEFCPIHSLDQIGFKKTNYNFRTPKLDAWIIDNYDKNRDYPALEATTQLGIALRFGTISIRSCVSFALTHNQTWLNELIWREFFMQIMYHFPKVVNESFKEKYDGISWRNNEQEFEAWCTGTTGYPIVDAGMRELNKTGYMHNRVRMITASFLCKHLLIDWRWGEAYFAQKLNDYDLAANNGNWQWAAGSGCDAAPYFRVFNPELQSAKFDKDKEYIKKWVPEYGTSNYKEPIVEHKYARQRALTTYGQTLKAQE